MEAPLQVVIRAAAPAVPSVVTLTKLLKVKSTFTLTATLRYIHCGFTAVLEAKARPLARDGASAGGSQRYLRVQGVIVYS